MFAACFMFNLVSDIYTCVMSYLSNKVSAEFVVIIYEVKS